MKSDLNKYILNQIFSKKIMNLIRNKSLTNEQQKELLGKQSEIFHQGTLKNFKNLHISKGQLSTIINFEKIYKKAFTETNKNNGILDGKEALVVD